MFITLTPVNQFTNHSTVCRSSGKSKSGIHTILSMKHLMNKKTKGVLKPDIIIDHEQTAMLALLNGVRSTTTKAKPMPIGYKNNTAGGVWDNPIHPQDGGYDATQWGLEHSNAALEPSDFNSKTSRLVDSNKPLDEDQCYREEDEEEDEDDSTSCKRKSKIKDNL